jgi:hypothetical protein
MLDETSSVTGEFHWKQPNDRGELFEDEDAERSGRGMQAMLQVEKIGFDLLFPVGSHAPSPAVSLSSRRYLATNLRGVLFAENLQHRCGRQLLWLFGAFHVNSIGAPGIISRGLDSCFGQFGSQLVFCLSRSLLVAA